MGVRVCDLMVSSRRQKRAYDPIAREVARPSLVIPASGFPKARGAGNRIR